MVKEALNDVMADGGVSRCRMRKSVNSYIQPGLSHASLDEGIQFVPDEKRRLTSSDHKCRSYLVADCPGESMVL